MTNVGLRFREFLQGAYQIVQDELDQVIAGIQGTWAIEHNSDGTHGSMTADQITLGRMVLTDNAIRFPITQIYSSDANTLDDYEEGTWTPVIGGAGGTSGQTYSTQTGRYVKVGQLVVASFSTIFSAKGTITGNAQVQGLPYAIAGGDTLWTCAFDWDSLATNWVTITGSLLTASTTASIVGAAAAATSSRTALVTADFNNTSALRGTFCYRAAT